jgi:predicted nucleic acid-binding Zn ribbon protein
MPTSQERARALAREIEQSLRDIRAAEARVQQLRRELGLALSAARAESAATLTVVEYPTGRYECRRCGQGTLVTQPTRELPVCDNCGNRDWVGHEPIVTRIEPPPAKRFPIGMYACARCGGRTVVATDADEMSPCELCGASEFSPVPD